jgi:hypothetical protein
MRQGIGALAVLALAGSLSAAPAAEPAQDAPVTLSFKPPSFKTKFPRLQLSGVARILLDGTQVKINLHRLEEAWLAGGRLEHVYSGAGGGLAVVNDQKFAFQAGIPGPGKYLVQVEYLDDLQRQEISEALKKKLPQKHWNFEFLCWGDDLAPELGPGLKELTELAGTALEMVRRFEEACKTQETWLAAGKELSKDNAKLLPKIDASPLKKFYPAGMSQLLYTIRSLAATAPYFHFEEGKFAGGRSYHADNQIIKTHRDETFNWENLKRYTQEAIALAGREFCLWAVKDMRRTGGALRPEFVSVLQDKKKDNLGIAPYAERLEKAGLAEIDALEAEIRGGGASAKPPVPGDPARK